MGVHGLTTYVENHRNLLKDVKFRDSRLVIDGSSLYYRLYFNSGLDQQHGGDYDHFSHRLHQFFSALKDCQIQPYVVLDGGMDTSFKKFSTLKQRLQSKIKEADSLSRGCSGSVLPILARRVLIQVVTQRGVPLVQCPAEADWEIACLAYQWKCPVLTSDSDFYVFDLPGGYLPIQFFHWTNVNGKGPNCHISARRYTASGLCQWFGSINCDILALGAVLIGNDYGVLKEADKVFAMLYENDFIHKGGSRCRIDGLLLWLFSFRNVTEALEEVSEILGGQKHGKGQKSEVTVRLRKAMQEYSINAESSLAHWFSKAGNSSLGGQTSLLPDCLSAAAARGHLAPWAVDAFVTRKVFLIPQVENSQTASSHCSSEAIRRALYAILLRTPNGILTRRGGGAAQQPTGPHCSSQMQNTGLRENGSQRTRGGRGRGERGRGGRGQAQRGSSHHFPMQQGANDPLNVEQSTSAATAGPDGVNAPIVVEEYDRMHLNLKTNCVEVRPLGNHIHLEEVAMAPAPVRLGVLLEVLGVSGSALAPVPPHMQFSVAVTAFWMQNATPRPSQPRLHALVLCMVYGELSWNTQPGNSNSRHTIEQVNWAAERRVMAGLDRQRVRARERRGLDLAALHSFSQWQACLWSAMCLNELLLLPLSQPNLSCLFSGSLAHGLLRYLKGGGTAESLLAGGSFSGQLYGSLLSSVNNCRFKANPSSSSSGSGRRSRGQGRRGRGRGGRGRGAQGWSTGVDEMSNRFSLLMSE